MPGTNMNLRSFKESAMRERETFGTRLGFILVSVGCAVGLGTCGNFPISAGGTAEPFLF